MKKTLTIKNLGINGEGIGYINKKICFVENALPLEEVEVEIDVNERRYYKAHVTKILKKSSSRQEPICPLYEKCQGCHYMHMKNQDVLNYKRELVKEAMHKYTNYNVNIKAIHQNTTLHYNSEVNYSLYKVKGKLKIGLFQRETKYFSPLDKCFLHTQEMNDMLTYLEELFQRYDIKEYNDKLKAGLRFIMIKEIKNQFQIIFVTGNNGISKEFTKELSQDKRIKSLYYTINTARYQEFIEEGYKHIYGDKTLSYTYQDHQYHFSAKTNILQNESLELKKLSILNQMIPNNSQILSLYSGNNFIECELPHTLTSIDEYAWNIDNASKNAKRNFLLNKLFIKARVEKEVVHQCKKYAFDTMLIHLHKEALEDSILESIEKGKISQVILISESLGTSMKMSQLFENKYELKQLEIIDHPQTKNMTFIYNLIRK